MGRPPLPVGTAGKIGFLKLAKERIRARAQVRDPDGVTRAVTRYGPSKAVAERRLKEALRDREGVIGAGKITAATRLGVIADAWWAEVEDSDLAQGSKDTYSRTLENHVRPALGELQARECDTPAADRLLKAVRKEHGPGAAKSSRTVGSLLLGYAIRHGAIRVNPFEAVAKIPAGERKRPRALTVMEEAELLEKVAADEYAVQQDIVDLIEFMDGTGVRIGEALGIRRAVVDVDHGVIEINAKATFRKGRGGVMEERTKSEAGWRIIAVPSRVVDLCVKRMGMNWPANEHGLLFPRNDGGVRMPSNADRAMRQVFDRIGFDWVKSHTFRKTVVTRLDEAGLSAREIADHVGHENPSMTQNVYMGRGVASAAAAKILDRAK